MTETAIRPGPPQGAAWAAGLLRTAVGRRVFDEVTNLNTVLRRAGQASAMLRRIAHRGRDVRWLTSQARIYRGRAQRAADESAHHHERERACRHRGHAGRWTEVAHAYTWAAEYAEAAATGPEEDAAAAMHVAADQLSALQ